AGERVEGPAVARRHDVEMAVQMHTRPRRTPAAATDDVDARMTGRVLGQPFGGEVLRLEAAVAKATADQFGAVGVTLARRIDRRQPDQLAREVDNFVSGGVDCCEHMVSSDHDREHSPACPARPPGAVANVTIPCTVSDTDLV